jgi:iron complex outermembrane receptor protein
MGYLVRCGETSRQPLNDSPNRYHDRGPVIRIARFKVGGSIRREEEVMRLSQTKSCARPKEVLRKRLAARLIPLLLGISALLLSAVAGLAQTREDTKDVIDLSPEELKGVQVYSASMYLQSDREAPSSVTIVTADQIRAFGYRTLADILRTVRGFYISNDRNYSYVGVNGFSRPGDYNNRIQLLIDGHRLNDDVYGQALIGDEFPLDVDLIDRVEVVRGPSSSLYGANAFFAVINVITKRPEHIGGVELSGEAGGFRSYKGRSSYGGASHGVEILLSGTIYDSEGASSLFFPAFNSPATNNGIAQNADGDSSKRIFGSLRFGHFTVESLISTRDKQIPTASFGTVFNDPGTHTVDSAGYLDLSYDRTFQHGIELTSKVYFDRQTYHGVYVEPSATSPGSDVLNQDLAQGDWLGTNTRITVTLWRRHKVTAGTEIQDNLLQEQTNYNSSPYALFLNDRRSSIQGALYGQDEFTLSKGLILYTGLRYDHYDTFGCTVNPRLAVVYSPLERTTFKLIYGQAFRAPNNYELYYSDGFSQEANPLLRPERIKSTEFVWEQDLSSNFRATATGFDERITNLITQQTDPRNGLLVFDNSGRVRSKGIGLELAAKTHRGVEGRVSYTVQKTEDSATHVSLTNSPPQLVKAGLLLPVWSRRLSAGLEAQYTDARKTWAGTKTGAYAVANLTITSRELAGGFRLSASAYNLFNRKYSDPVGQEIVEPAVQQNGRDFRIQITRVFHAN